jgi:hypothetical protein
MPQLSTDAPHAASTDWKVNVRTAVKCDVGHEENVVTNRLRIRGRDPSANGSSPLGMHLNFRLALVMSPPMRAVRRITLVAVGALIAGCRTGRTPGSSGAPAGDARAIAAATLSDRCALVATIVTGSEARIFEDVLEVKATLATPNGSLRPFFAADERCSDRMVVGATPSGPEDGGLFVSIDLSESDKGGYAFKAAGVVTLAGHIAKAADGAWRIVGSPSLRRQPRQLDRTPVERVLSSAVAAGQAEVRFEIDTGADIMAARAHEAGLAVVFRYDKRELRQVVASCPEAVRGSALGDLIEPVLDLAGCDGFFRLVHRGKEVIVERTDGGGGGAAVIVTSIPIPRGIREVRGPVR